MQNSRSLPGRAIVALTRWACSRRGRRWADAAAASLRDACEALENVDFDLESNGEARILRSLAPFQPKVFFDVGANQGRYSQLILGLYPNAEIHAFEPVPSTFAILRQSFAANARLKLNNFGLGDEDTQQVMYLPAHDPSNLTATACKIEGMRSHIRHYRDVIDCEMRRGARYFEENLMTSIDFMKIDVEGFELRVLRGFEGHISSARMIQFEYGEFNISSHDLLVDIYRFLTTAGFSVGKIYPRCVEFFEYQPSYETFHGSNFLAVRNSERELISALARYGG